MARSALLSLAGLAALVLSLVPEPTFAATINVTCGDVPGLKAAITGAAPGDTISLAPHCTYTLTAIDNTDGGFGPNGLPLINKQLTINGNDATIARSSAAEFRFFDVAGVGLTVDGLTLSNGSVASQVGGAGLGGAVLLKIGGSALTVTNSTFSGNSADSGGAITSFGTVAVLRSTFVGNSAVAGGAIYESSGVLRVTNSTFAGNTAASTGSGSAITNLAITTVASSTVSANTALNFNGGALANADVGTFRLLNSVVSNNIGGNCGTTGALGPVTDGGHNISWPDNTCPGGNADPKLGPLANNGGPTRTFALKPGSPAIDAVPPSGAGCPATDQRGVSRPQGPSCDIGAFELAFIPTPAPIPSPPSTGHGPDAGWPQSAGAGETFGGLILLVVAGQVRRRRSSDR